MAVMQFITIFLIKNKPNQLKFLSDIKEKGNQINNWLHYLILFFKSSNLQVFTFTFLAIRPVISPQIIIEQRGRCRHPTHTIQGSN